MWASIFIKTSIKSATIATTIITDATTIITDVITTIAVTTTTTKFYILTWCLQWICSFSLIGRRWGHIAVVVGVRVRVGVVIVVGVVFGVVGVEVREEVCKNLQGMDWIQRRGETRIAGYSLESIRHFRLKIHLKRFSFRSYYVL